MLLAVSGFAAAKSRVQTRRSRGHNAYCKDSPSLALALALKPTLEMAGAAADGNGIGNNNADNNAPPFARSPEES